MKLQDLDDDLFPLIYSFIYQLPLQSSVIKKQTKPNHYGTSLAFPHTCSKILRVMEKHNPFQFDKFLQFYCLGIKNERFEQLQSKFIDKSDGNDDDDDLSEILPVVFYLNFPELTFLEHSQFQRDLVPLERKFRRVFNTYRNQYEDFFFKIDRIIEMICAFITIIKKKLNVEELSQVSERTISLDNLNIPVSGLLAVISEVDKVINQCLRIFHWKAFNETYFEEQYLKIPKELTLVAKKYADCERIISILNSETDEFLVSLEELNALFSTIGCYYCDKLAAIIYFQFFRRKAETFEETCNNVALKESLYRYLVYYGMHNSPDIINNCSETLKQDEEIINRLIYAAPDTYSLIDEKFQNDQSIISTCIYQDARSIIEISNHSHGTKLLTEFFVNNLEEFYHSIETISIRGLYSINDIISSFLELLRNDPSHPTLSKNVHFFYTTRFLKAWYSLIEKEWKSRNETKFYQKKKLFMQVLQQQFEEIDLYKREFLNDDIPTLECLEEIVKIEV